MNETFIPASDHKKKNWCLIDCKNQKLGRIAVVISRLLSGKQKQDYHPSFDVGDYVIVINAQDMLFDSDRPRFSVNVPGRPGRSLKQVLNALPSQLLMRAVYGMLANGAAKKSLAKRLKIYNGPEHPHAAQNPIRLDEVL
uniref:Large ribosomal subunit protein uL13c n=1 Tax=Pseudictyota dubia TaxID=2749911 RepID=A0A2U9NRD4_9STRA|nr:ribosomal protein L13 [Pseudictyota dubia]AWT39575.1 ribosomal protein L13 [Pseudictyota dubia]